tara:strand:+ start:1003 stop:1221 length:219 start_codon:yes stop_codon:yes gene_type:complete
MRSNILNIFTAFSVSNITLRVYIGYFRTNFTLLRGIKVYALALIASPTFVLLCEDPQYKRYRLLSIVGKRLY